MPRRGKGHRSQPPRATAEGQEFGEAAAQIRAQQVMPLPDAPRPENLQPAQGTPGPLPGAPQVGHQPQEDPLAAVQQALLAQGAGRPLTAPTSRPGEPVTAGLPMGPGPGPEALTNQARQRNLAMEGFEAVALATGDMDMLRMAAIARQVTAGNGRRSR